MTWQVWTNIMHEAGFNLSLRGHPDFPEKDNDGNLLFWTSGGNKEFQAIFALAYEAGRKYENEVCAKEVDRWIGCDLLAAAIRAILAQPEQEPVACGVPNTRPTEKAQFMMLLHSADGCQYPDQLVPLYTAPPQREWVGLTDEEIREGNKDSWVTRQAWESAAWWAEAKLKEKNT